MEPQIFTPDELGMIQVALEEQRDELQRHANKVDAMVEKVHSIRNPGPIFTPAPMPSLLGMDSPEHLKKYVDYIGNGGPQCTGRYECSSEIHIAGCYAGITQKAKADHPDRTHNGIPCNGDNECGSNIHAQDCYGKVGN